MKKRISNDLTGKRHKTGSRNQASSNCRSHSSNTHENTNVVIRKNFADYLGLRRTCRLTWFALKQLSVVCIKHFLHFLDRSHDAVIANARRYFSLHVCFLHFPLVSLYFSNFQINLASFHVLRIFLFQEL